MLLPFLFYIFLVLSAIQILHSLFFLKSYNKIIKISNISKEDYVIPYSIIICGKNEYKNIQNNLSSILKQIRKHKDSEVIFVNHRSEDNSKELLHKLQENNPHLKVLEIAKNKNQKVFGKKEALLYAFREAKGNYLLLTDADCKINNLHWAENWVAWMEKHHVDAGLGLGIYLNNRGLLQKFIQFETLQSYMQYGSYAIQGNAYMGVGRNIAYKKESLDKVINNPSFLEYYLKEMSGDDDLLIQYLAKNNYTILPYFSKNQSTLSLAKSNYKEYKKQKSRHLSIGKHYAFKDKLKLGFYALSIGFWWLFSTVLFLLFILNPLLFYSPYFYYFLLFFIISLIFKYLNYRKWHKMQIKEEKSITFVFMEWLWSLYHLVNIPSIFWKKSKTWK